MTFFEDGMLTDCIEDPNTTDGSNPQFSVQEAVAPGGCTVYKWLIPYQSAPTKGNPVRLWSYHSFVNMPSET